MSNFIDITARAVGDCLQVTARLAPLTVEDWGEACDSLRAALGPRPRHVELHLDCPPESPPQLEDASQGSEALARLMEQVGRLHDSVDDRGGLLLVVAKGHVPGPLLSLALEADLLVLRDGMAGSLLIWEDRPLPLPRDLVALAARLGRARALQLALVGGRVEAEELRARGGAVCGEAGDRALRAAREGSRVAQLAAASLRRRNEPERRGAEALERAAFALCFAEPDRAEGVAAFSERRKPVFERPPESKSPRNSK